MTDTTIRYAVTAHGQNSKFQVSSGTPGTCSAIGSRCREQAFFNSVQALPCGLGQRRVRPYKIADHLPRREVECALGCRPHRQRNRALRAETDALRRRLLARSHSHGLGEQENGYRFLSRLKLTTAAQAIHVIQRLSPRSCGQIMKRTDSTACH